MSSHYFGKRKRRKRKSATTFDGKFDKSKIAQCRKLMPKIQRAIRKMADRPNFKFPARVEAMTEEELTAPDGGSWAGVYLPDEHRIKMNPHLTLREMCQNLIHEQIHSIDGDLSESSVKTLTNKVMKEVLGSATEHGVPRRTYEAHKLRRHMRERRDIEGW